MTLCKPPKTLLQLTSRYWLTLSPRSQQRWINRAFHYWRSLGFPYVSLSSQEIQREFCQLSKIEPPSVLKGRELRAGTVGLRLANYFQRHMLRIQANRYRSPWHVFSDDQALKLCIRKSLRHCHDRRPLAPNAMRRSLQTLTNTSSVWNFRPALARTIYQMYSSDGDSVVDFSAGFGGRLLAALTLKRHYIGIEPSRRTFCGLSRMQRRLLRLRLTLGTASLHNTAAEDALFRLPDRSATLVFTSPPYFDRERYANDMLQSFRRYPDYDRWRDEFLEPVIRESARILVPRGKLVLSVANCGPYPIAWDCLAIARNCLSHHETLKMRIPVRPYQHRVRRPYRHEPVYVFERGRR
jgi:SAM-dependent methyltransferase